MIREYEEFVQRIKHKTGIDLSLYKETQMKRRLTSLRDKRGHGDFRSYFEALSTDQTLLDEFLDRMTINVSEFYRNQKRFEVLEKQVIPHLLQKNKKLKIWSAACSTGEEPYTLVMILSQFMPLSQIEVIASDIDINAMERAKKGMYPERSLKEVSKKLRDQFFIKEGSFYKLNQDIMDRVIFKKHNLLADSYESDCDLIVCRNVLIYFTELAKESIYSNFSKSLKDRGIFFVGSTEQIFSPAKFNFRAYDTFFYEKVEK